MNKRISVLLLTLGLTALLMPACQNKTDKPTSQPDSSDVESESEEHKHKYSSDWTYDHKYHWHAAICGHDVVKDKAEHTFNEEEIEEGGDTYSKFTCTICGYSYNDNEMFKVRWYSDEDCIIYSENYPTGAIPSYDVDTYGVPTKEYEDISHRYEFTGWDKPFTPIEGKRDYYAQYELVENKYHVTWKNYDGTVLYQHDVLAGQTPVYPYANPTRPDDGYDASYTFEGWSPEPGPITGDTVYTAQYSRQVISDTLKFREIEGGTAYEVSGYNEPISTTVTIPAVYHDKAVKGIGAEAFDGCASITSVILPSSVTYFGNYAFRGCISLVSFGGEKLDNVTSFGKGVFKNCLSFVYENNKIYGLTAIPDEMFYCCPSLGDTITGELFVHATTIGKQAFYGCANIRIVNISTCDVQRIEEEAFYGCSSLEFVGIPDINCNYIGPRAFYGCTGLQSIAFNSNSATICESAFENCVDLASFSGYNSRSLSSIGNYAFKNTKLSTVNLKTSQTNNLTSIGDYAFEGCGYLTTFKLPTSVISIGYGALKSTPQLATLEIPFVGHSKTDNTNQYLGYIFGCQKENRVSWGGGDGSALTSINLYYSNLTTIRSYAFYDVGGDNTEIVFPSTMTTVEEYGFYCFRGKTLNLADGITMTNWSSISQRSFDSDYLKNLSIPFVGTRKNTSSDMDKSTYDANLRIETLFAGTSWVDLDRLTCYTQYYPTYGFYNCYIDTLVIGAWNTQYISDRAFSGTKSLKRIEFEGKVAQFNNIPKSSTWKTGLPSGITKVYCSDGEATI